jgi:hypothetical protein
MAAFRWTKLQDFCLRLGLLKATVGLFPVDRRSIPGDVLLRRLDECLFRPAWASHRELAAAASRVLGETLEANVTCAEAALIASNWRSWGQAIKEKTSYKVLEWAVSAGLVSTGYRITERGLILRSLMGENSCEALREGDLLSYNPFVIERSEAVFFLYHIGETDEVSIRIAIAAGRLPARSIISTRVAHKMAFECLEVFLLSSEHSIPMRDLPKFRVARELAQRIRREVYEVDDFDAPREPRAALATTLRRPRRTTKNADHLAIPRFEQLVDLGLLSKNVVGGVRGKALKDGKVGWTFVVEPRAVAFASAFDCGLLQFTDRDWRLSDLSKISLSTYLGSSNPDKVGADQALEILEGTFAAAHRAAGMTPFESIAVLAVVKALEKGLRVEIEQLNEILLGIKQSGTLSDFISFAAGNQVERMFIRVRPGLAAAYRSLPATRISS